MSDTYSHHEGEKWARIWFITILVNITLSVILGFEFGFITGFIYGIMTLIVGSCIAILLLNNFTMMFRCDNCLNTLCISGFCKCNCHVKGAKFDSY